MLLAHANETRGLRSERVNHAIRHKPRRMTVTLLLVQLLNGAQLGILLFLVAAGLTLVFGVMNFINLAHGVQYMLGAYLAASLGTWSGSFWIGMVLALPATLLVG